MGEETENYVLRIRKAGTILREVNTVDAGWVYTLSEQMVDGVSAPFKVEVTQVSASFGPGLPAVLTVQS